MTSPAIGNANTAQRIINAYADFAETLVSFSGISPQQAEKVTDFYLKRKFAKLDCVNGRISVKHGAFLGAEVIRRAAAECHSNG